MATTRTINRTTYSNNPFVKALIDNRVWTPGDTITYYLKPTDLDGNGQLDLVEKGADKAIAGAYGAWAAVANIKVQQVGNPADAVWIEQVVTGASGGGATHTMPYTRNRATEDSGGKYNILNTSAAQFEKGGQWFGIALHEIGHGLGLNHTHETGDYPGVAADDADAAGSYGLNGKLYSIMSYNGLTQFTYGTPVTPMAFDIAAVQALYGANTATATGNDVYVIPTANVVGTWYACIWDAGGIDTISVGAGAATGATIDLRAATLLNEEGGGGRLSSVAGIDGGFTIANGVVIENATGSTFADMITGNQAANRLVGNGGADTIYGLGGDDVLVAGQGVARALVKPASQVIASQATAASLDPWFNLSADPTIANATTIPHATARATASGQAEWFKFTVARAGQIVIDIDGATFDTELYLHNAGGTLLVSNDDSRPIDPGSVANPNDPAETRDSAITYNVVQPGTYYVRVERYGSDATTANGTYSLHVSVPGATVTAPGLQGSLLDGGDGNDFIQGGIGDDTILGGLGDDSIYLGGDFTAGDRVSGGAGNDQVALQGSYRGLALSAGMLTDVETLAFLSGGDQRFGDLSGARYSYEVTATDATVARGAMLTVFATGLAAGEDLTFNGAAETDGSFLMFGGLGVDRLTGGAGGDAFYFGPDRFGAGDAVVGGGAVDQLGIDGLSGPLTLRTGNADVEVVALLRGPDGRNAFGTITVDDSWVASGQMKTITAVTSFQNRSGPLASDLIIDGSGELDGSLRILSGSGNDTVSGGAGNDAIFGGLGRDTLRGGAGADVFLFNTAAESAGREFDTILDFDRAADAIQVNGRSVGGFVDRSGGVLSNASFDADLANAVGASLTGSGGVFFTASAGDYAGQTFLVINADGADGYGAGRDLVIRTSTGNLAAAFASDGGIEAPAPFEVAIAPIELHPHQIMA